MARILYGVMGNTNGHLARVQAVIQRLPEHEFYFVGGGRVPETLRDQYPVLEVPVARTVYRRQRAMVWATIGHLTRCVVGFPAVQRRIRDTIESWQPDLAICDREFYIPHAARQAGLKVFSLDHSHVLQVCQYPVPADQMFSWSLSRVEDKLFFDWTNHNLVTSFFHPPVSRRRGRTELLPAVIRRTVRDFTPSTGDYIFVYQTAPTFGALIEVLRQLRRPAIVYGYRQEKVVEGNITFKPFDKRGILEDLAGCAYAVVNGGHNLICEALYFGKPLLCFPLAVCFEQYINAYHVRELGFGDFSTSRQPTPALFAGMEARLLEYRRNIAREFRDGTDVVTERVRELIREYSLTGQQIPEKKGIGCSRGGGDRLGEVRSG